MPILFIDQRNWAESLARVQLLLYLATGQILATQRSEMCHPPLLLSQSSFILKPRSPPSTLPHPCGSSVGLPKARGYLEQCGPFSHQGKEQDEWSYFRLVS